MYSLDLVPIDITVLKECEKSFELKDINQALCDVLDHLNSSSYLGPLEVAESLTRIIYFLDDESGNLVSSLDDSVYKWFVKHFDYFAEHYFYINIYKTQRNFTNDKLKKCWIRIINNNCEAVRLPEVTTVPFYLEYIVDSKGIELVELPNLKNVDDSFRVYNKRADHHKHVSVYVSSKCFDAVDRTLYEDNADATVYAC